jgi:hypothetical protein
MTIDVSDTAIDVVAAVFVVVSLISLAIQVGALRVLFSWPVAATSVASKTHRGLLRTSICRVVAAAAYVITGLVILFSRDALPLLSLSTFTAVQVMWISNAVADVRLRRWLAHDAQPPPHPTDPAG